MPRSWWFPSVPHTCRACPRLQSPFLLLKKFFLLVGLLPSCDSFLFREAMFSTLAGGGQTLHPPEPWSISVSIAISRGAWWLSRLRSDFGSGYNLAVCGLEPRVGLCADGSEPGACFGFCVSLSLCPSPLPCLPSVSVSFSRINKC